MPRTMWRTSASGCSAVGPLTAPAFRRSQSVLDLGEIDLGFTFGRFAEHPEADVRHIVRGIVRRGLQPVPAKAAISLRLDRDVLEWYKAQGTGYQTRINTVLRAFRDASA